MSENIAFTERTIAKVQRLSIEDGPFVEAITEYLMKHDRLAYNFGRKLWWVKHPSQGMQVAVWMMPACEPFEERVK